MFQSSFKELGLISFPDFSGISVMMMPIVIGDNKTNPIKEYHRTCEELFRDTNPECLGKVGYLTIHEKNIQAGDTHRRAGKHVDGILEDGKIGGWGGPPGPWGAIGLGMLLASSVEGCKAWNQSINGEPGYDGDCEHLSEELNEGTLFQRNKIYWLDGLCIHESLPMEKDTQRQLIRLSMPSSAPWFEGYTENPYGIKPTGEILSKRKYMT